MKNEVRVRINDSTSITIKDVAASVCIHFAAGELLQTIWIKKEEWQKVRDAIANYMTEEDEELFLMNMQKEAR